MGEERMPDLFCHSLERKGFLQDWKAWLDVTVRYCWNCNNCMKSGNVADGEDGLNVTRGKCLDISGHATTLPTLTKQHN